MGPGRLRGFFTSTTQPGVEAGVRCPSTGHGEVCEGLGRWWEEGKRRMVVRGNERKMKRIKKWHKEREERRFPEDMEHKANNGSNGGGGEHEENKKE